MQSADPLSPSPAPGVNALWLDGLREAAAARLPWLWQGYLAPGNVTLLTSQWKAGKTTLLAILLDRMKRGGELAGLPVRAGKAVVLSEESPAHWCKRSEKFDFAGHVCWVCRPFADKPRPVQWLRLVDDVSALHREHGFELLAVDPLASFLPCRSENHADAMLDALLPLQRLTKEGVSVLLLHHPRKKSSRDGMAARGSGALPGYADVLVEMHWYEKAEDSDRRRRLLAWSRHDETPRQRVVELNADGTDYTALGDFEEEAFLHVSPVLVGVLRDARRKLTRREILGDWPQDHPRPEVTALWRWLDVGVQQGAICRQGGGLKNDPYRYWLVGQEEKWQADPVIVLEQRLAEAREAVQHFTTLGPPG